MALPTEFGTAGFGGGSGSAALVPTIPVDGTFEFTTQFGSDLFDRLQPWQTDDLAVYCDALGQVVDPIYAVFMPQGIDGDPDFVPPYGALFDVDLCPAGSLPYLAQFVGTTILPGTSEDAARQQIAAHANMNRGTVLSMRLAAASTMAGRSFTAILDQGSTVLMNASPLTGIFMGSFISGPGIPAGATVVSVTASTVMLSAPALTSGPSSLVSKNPRIVERVGNDPYRLTLGIDPAETANPAAALAAALTQKPGGLLLTLVTSRTPTIAEYTRPLKNVTVSLNNATIADVT